MFHTLHRIYVVGWISMVLGSTAWLYPRTGISEPLADWYNVWQNSQNVPTIPVDLLSGTVVKVTGPTSFALRGADQTWYSIGLIGVVLPNKGQPAKNGQNPATQIRRDLSSLILSNAVDVTVVSMDPQHRGLGIVRLGATNINATLIESGLVQLKREFIRGLPIREQYQLIRAERRGRIRSDIPLE